MTTIITPTTRFLDLHDEDKTKIFDRICIRDLSQEFAEALGIWQERVRPDLRSNSSAKQKADAVRKAVNNMNFHVLILKQAYERILQEPFPVGSTDSSSASTLLKPYLIKDIPNTVYQSLVVDIATCNVSFAVCARMDINWNHLDIPKQASPMMAASSFLHHPLVQEKPVALLGDAIRRSAVGWIADKYNLNALRFEDLPDDTRVSNLNPQYSMELRELLLDTSFDISQVSSGLALTNYHVDVGASRLSQAQALITYLSIRTYTKGDVIAAIKTAQTIKKNSTLLANLSLGDRYAFRRDLITSGVDLKTFCTILGADYARFHLENGSVNEDSHRINACELLEIFIEYNGFTWAQVNRAFTIAKSRVLVDSQPTAPTELLPHFELTPLGRKYVDDSSGATRTDYYQLLLFISDAANYASGATVENIKGCLTDSISDAQRSLSSGPPAVQAWNEYTVKFGKAVRDNLEALLGELEQGHYITRILPPSPPLPTVAPSTPISARNDCVICLEKAPNVLLQPCNHLVVCETCDVRITVCPMCRKDVLTRVKVFLP